jgi:DNA mismatch repair protein MutL
LELVDWAKQQLAAQMSAPAGEIGQRPLVAANDNFRSRSQHSADENVREPSAADDLSLGAILPVGASPEQTEPPVPATGATPYSPSGGGYHAMQIHDSYLVVETEDGLTVIDQHALHERVVYEHLRRRVLDGAVESQRMLVPESVELNPQDAALLLEHVDVLRQLGFAVEEFGKNTVLLSAYPAMLARTNHAGLIRDIAEQLDGSEKNLTRRDILDKLLHMMACKAAVKAGDRLVPEEIESLLEQRHLIDDPHHCPHGRPTALTLSRTELDRQFGRLG